MLARTANEPSKIDWAALYLRFHGWNSSPKKSLTPLMYIFQVEYNRASLMFVRRPTVGEKWREKRTGPSNTNRCRSGNLSVEGTLSILRGLSHRVKEAT
jgi:hypothetical protein